MKFSNKHRIAWFLFGLGSQLQLVGSLSFTELFVFLSAPVLFFGEWYYIKRNGLQTLFVLSLLVVLGCVVSCLANHCSSLFVIRGLATTAIAPCTIVAGHWMLRRDMNGFKWMLIGGFLSGILCVFIFQHAVDIQAYGTSGSAIVEDIVSGPLFWIGKVTSAMLVPVKGFYLHLPIAYSIIAPFFAACYAMATSASGRAMALGSLGSAALVLIGGKTRAKMHNVCRYFWLFVIVVIVGVLFFKKAYSFSAEQGWLGEKAYAKFERQTRGGNTIGKLLLSGRMESFVGLLACADKPIIGFGPWAIDNNGYGLEFLRRYGDVDDYDYAVRMRENQERRGYVGFNMIAAHSCIVQFWLWFGIFGLIFWLYVLFVFVRFLKQDCWAVPQWFMWVAGSIPMLCWHVFFSVFGGDRVGCILLIVACFVERAVRKGRQPLPVEMISEIMKVERNA